MHVFIRVSKWSCFGSLPTQAADATTFGNAWQTPANHLCRGQFVPHMAQFVFTSPPLGHPTPTEPTHWATPYGPAPLNPLGLARVSAGQLRLRARAM